MKAIKPPTAKATRKATTRLVKDAARNKGEARRQLLARLAATVGKYRIEGSPNLRPGDVVDVETSEGRETMIVAAGGTLVPFTPGEALMLNSMASLSEPAR